MRYCGLAVCLLALLSGAAWAQKGVTIVKTAYGGWPNCYRMTNGQIELVATSDVGPRIIRLGFVGGQNLFAEFPQEIGKTGGDVWRSYGGHRLWHAPEGQPRSYWPDNVPVEVAESGNTLTLTQPTEGSTGIQKAITVTMDPDRNLVTVVHRLTNHNLWAVELAPWALSVMNKGGMGIVPAVPFAPHPQSLLPARPLVQWTYTNMADPRWRWGTKYIVLRQDPQNAAPQKIGIGNQEGWGAYSLGEDLFIKSFRYVPGAAYPDMGCSMEFFTNADMLEVESVAPLVKLEPAASVEHTEKWLVARVGAVDNTDAAIDEKVLPRAKELLAAW